MLLSEIVNLKTEFEYNGSCVNCDIFHYDATMMSNAIQDSTLLKPEYLDTTNIPVVSPKSVQKFLLNKKPMIIGYHKNLLWVFFPHVDKHFFYTHRTYLDIKPDMIEHRELDRGI